MDIFNVSIFIDDAHIMCYNEYTKCEGGYCMATVTMSIRMDSDLKKQAEVMLADMGLNMTTATNMFLRQVVRQGKIPFEIATDIPNATTLAALEEGDRMINDPNAKRYSSVEALFEDLMN